MQYLYSTLKSYKDTEVLVALGYNCLNRCVMGCFISVQSVTKSLCACLKKTYCVSLHCRYRLQFNVTHRLTLRTTKLLSH